MHAAHARMYGGTLRSWALVLLKPIVFVKVGRWNLTPVSES